MNDLDYAVLLLEKAKEDLAALGGMLIDTRFSDSIFGFHAQQAVEKSLKAAISACGIQYPLTHSISELSKLLPDKDPIYLKAVDFKNLSTFAVTSRYPLPELPSLEKSRSDL